MKSFYPAWADVIGKTVKQGFKFTHENKLYKTIQPELTIQEQYVPGVDTGQPVYQPLSELVGIYIEVVEDV